MNYGDIQTQFLATLNRRDCTTAQAKAFIQQGIMRLQRELRCPANEQNSTYTVTNSYNGVPIPSDLLELISIIPLTTSGGVNTSSLERLDKVDISRAMRRAVNPGIPACYARDGGRWVLGPAPSTGDTIAVKYYAESTPLVNDSDTNTVATMAWDLIMYAGLVPAADYFGHKKRDDWEGYYGTLLQQLNNMADEDEMNGAAEVQPCYEWPSDTTNDYSYSGGW
jgi:hypothetical protein